VQTVFHVLEHAELAQVPLLLPVHLALEDTLFREVLALEIAVLTVLNARVQPSVQPASLVTL